MNPIRWQPPTWLSDILLAGPPQYTNKSWSYFAHSHPSHIAFIFHSTPANIRINSFDDVHLDCINRIVEILDEITSPASHTGQLCESVRGTSAYVHYADVVARIAMILLHTVAVYTHTDVLANILARCITVIFTAPASPYICALHVVIANTAFLSRETLKRVVANFTPHQTNAIWFLSNFSRLDRMRHYDIPACISAAIESVVSIDGIRPHAVYWDDASSHYQELIDTFAFPAPI